MNSLYPFTFVRPHEPLTFVRPHEPLTFVRPHEPLTFVRPHEGLTFDFGPLFDVQIDSSAHNVAFSYV